MTGDKMARIRECSKCENRSTRHSSIDDWPRCRANNNGYLDDDYMEGPDANCPLGLWAGLDPIDLEAEAAEQKAAAIAKETDAMKRFVDILSPDEKTGDAIRPKIEALSDAKIIRHPETAAALETYVDNRAAAITP